MITVIKLRNFADKYKSAYPFTQSFRALMSNTSLQLTDIFADNQVVLMFTHSDDKLLSSYNTSTSDKLLHHSVESAELRRR